MLKDNKPNTLFLVFTALIILSACVPTPTATPTHPANTNPADWLVYTVEVNPSKVYPTYSPSVSTPTPTAKTSLQPAITSTVDSSPLPTATHTGLPSCSETAGKLNREVMQSQILGKALEYSLYLPPCYASQTTLSYPVLYMLHGLSATDEQWVRMNINGVADRLITDGTASPFLIVMPKEPNFYPIDQSLFDRVLVEELVPWIDSQYRTQSTREFRAVGGLSRGAAWALRIGVYHWQNFSATGMHSLPISTIEARRTVNALGQIPEVKRPRLFLDIGDRDPEWESTLAYEELLTESSIPHVWYLFNGRHEEAYWQAHMEIYLRWYTENW